MTAQILKSQMGDEAAFRAKLESYVQFKVSSLDAVGPTPPDDPFLEQFIKRTPQGDPHPDKFEFAYEVVDDTPTVEELRAKALAELRAKETAEIEAIVPPHKQRLVAMNNAKALERIQQAKIQGETPAAADQKIVDDFAELTRRISDIHYAYAQREAEL